MKKLALPKRILSGLLATIIVAGTVLSASADTLVIDQSGFTDPTITKGTVYYWHKGTPPTTLDGTSYPVLMVWDDKYYFSTGSDFYNEVIGTNKSRRAEKCVSPEMDDRDDRQDVSYGQQTAIRLSGFYHKGRCYTGRSVSELPFDYSVLKSTGSAVSFGAPDLPRFVAVDIQDEEHMGNQLIGNDLKEVLLDGERVKYYAIWIPNPNTGSVLDQNKYWLTLTHRVYSRYDELDKSFGTKASFINSMDWFLDVTKLSQSNFTSTSYTYTPEYNGLNSRGYEARPPKITLKDRCWAVYPIERSSQYHLNTMGTHSAQLNSFYASSGRGELISYVKNIDKINHPSMLLHSGSSLVSAGRDGGPVNLGWFAGIGIALIDGLDYYFNGIKNPYKSDCRFEDQGDTWKNARPGFDLYWGEPSTISFCQLDFL